MREMIKHHSVFYILTMTHPIRDTRILIRVKASYRLMWDNQMLLGNKMSEYILCANYFVADVKSQ